MTTEHNKRIVKEFLEHFERVDVDALMSLLTEDLEWWVTGKPHLFPGAGVKTKADAAAAFSGVTGLFADGLRMTPTNIVAEGDQVAVEIEAYGEATNGKVYSNHYAFIFKLRDGRISVMREYFDTAQIMELLS